MADVVSFIALADGGWFCPCHGSHYDISGRIRKGPAPVSTNPRRAQNVTPADQTPSRPSSTWRSPSTLSTTTRPSLSSVKCPSLGQPDAEKNVYSRSGGGEGRKSVLDDCVWFLDEMVCIFDSGRWREIRSSQVSVCRAMNRSILENEEYRRV